MAGPVRSVSQAFSLMRLLAVAAAPQSLTDLVRATGTSPSSCLNLLRTLLTEGVIEADTVQTVSADAKLAGHR
jgi:IclR family acetate operon transcriptional repressor